MPKYRFLCGSCGAEKERLVSSSTTEADCGCGGKMSRQLPTSISTQVLEIKDPHRGVLQRKNVNAQLKERMRKNHDRYDLEEKIDRYGMDDAQRHGWTRKVKRV